MRKIIVLTFIIASISCIQTEKPIGLNHTDLDGFTFSGCWEQLYLKDGIAKVYKFDEQSYLVERISKKTNTTQKPIINKGKIIPFKVNDRLFINYQELDDFDFTSNPVSLFELLKIKPNQFQLKFLQPTDQSTNAKVLVDEAANIYSSQYAESIIMDGKYEYYDFNGDQKEANKWIITHKEDC